MEEKTSHKKPGFVFVGGYILPALRLAFQIKMKQDGLIANEFLDIVIRKYTGYKDPAPEGPSDDKAGS